jgi:predicted alpha-1,6-mannanase (GH76 family)
MTDSVYAIQYTENARSETQAAEMLDGLRSQDDFLDGRVLSAVGSIPWRIQVFFEDAPVQNEYLPLGCRRVMLLPNRWPLTKGE